MKFLRQYFEHPGDAVRNLVYPVIPIFAVACLWTVGLAGSLQSKVDRELGPYTRHNLPLPSRIPPAQPIVVSADPRE